MRTTSIAILGGLALLLGSAADSAACDRCGCHKHVSLQKSHAQRHGVQKGAAQKGCSQDCCQQKGCGRRGFGKCSSGCGACGGNECGDSCGRHGNRRRVGSHCGPMPQTCYDPRYGCYGSGGRHMNRYPAFHGFYYRRPYNYRNLFDYPWHAEPHEPTSLFSYNVPQEENTSEDAPGFENGSGPTLEDVAPPLPEEARRGANSSGPRTRQASVRQSNWSGYRR